MIAFERVSRTYDHGRVVAVRELSLHIEAGEFLVLLGESGSGKTTTLKMINRLIEPSSGRIRIEDRDARSMSPTELRRRLGYVFQGIGLFPHMTAAENVGIALRLQRRPADAIRARVRELLTVVGLEPEAFVDRYPHELSGGQRQRVGVARALATQPRVLLMDEPFGALDPLTREDIRSEMRRLHRELGLTIVMVTHDVTEALLLADRIAVMREGELVGAGTPRRLLNDPPHDYIRQLMSMTRRHAAAVEAIAAGGRAGRSGA